MQDQLAKRLTQAIAENVFPGCVVGVIKKDDTRLVLPLGRYTYKPDSGEVTEDSIFDVASITKSIPTSSLALMLIDQGKLRLDEQLIKFVPEFRNSDREQVLIQHLLTQTLCYTFSLAQHKKKSPDEILNLIFTSEFKKPPGTSCAYSNTTSILLGIAIERIMGDTLDRLAQKYFFEPLGMTRTTFRPLELASKNEIVPTEIDPWRGRTIQGEVNDENAWKLGEKMVVGSAGLFSTVPDMLKFLKMLLNEGVSGERRYFSKEIIGQMYTNQISELNKSTGLGWELNQAEYMGGTAALQTFGKTSFTGCSVVIEPELRIGLVLLSNTIFPHRKPDRTRINDVRRDLADIVENFIAAS